MVPQQQLHDQLYLLSPPQTCQPTMDGMWPMVLLHGGMKGWLMWLLMHHLYQQHSTQIQPLWCQQAERVCSGGVMCIISLENKVYFLTFTSMWIKAPIYVKLIQTTFTEMPDGESYKIDCIFTIYRDAEKKLVLCTQSWQFENVPLEELTLMWVYGKVMELFQDPEVS